MSIGSKEGGYSDEGMDEFVVRSRPKWEGVWEAWEFKHPTISRPNCLTTRDGERAGGNCAGNPKVGEEGKSRLSEKNVGGAGVANEWGGGGRCWFVRGYIC